MEQPAADSYLVLVKNDTDTVYEKLQLIGHFLCRIAFTVQSTHVNLRVSGSGGQFFNVERII